jgi:amino acid adenylation domain-containing protein
MSATTLQNMTRAERAALFLQAQAARAGKTSPGRPADIQPRQTASAFWPLSYAQRRLWFIAHMWPAAHNLPVGLRLVGTLDGAALQASIDRIVRRHEALRTRFDVVDEQPVQRIVDACGCPLTRHDPFGAGENIEEAVEHWRRVESATPFDIAKGPLIRGRLLRTGEREHVLLLTMHHIVSDGWSLGVLAGELGELYRAYAMEGLAHTVDPLPPLAVQYADYAVWQREWLSGHVRQRQLDFWVAELAGAPALTHLPTDRPRPPVQDHRGQSLSLAFDRPLTAGLKALSHRHGTTLYMTLLAAWGALVARLSGQEDVVIGSPVANRTRTEVEPLLGFFVNTLALRLDVSDRPSVSQWLSRVRDRVLRAQSHQDLPFEQVVEALQPQRTLAHTPLFQLTFAWQNTPDEAMALGDVELHGLPPHSGEHVAQYDLALELREEEQGIVGTLVYAGALYEPATMHRHIAYLEAILRGMVRDDTQAVDAIPILDDTERRQLLDGFNDPVRAYAADSCIHDLFERQAVRTPDAIAVEHDDTRLTYRQLDVAANRLARHLRALGVVAEERVALCLPRGIDLVLAMLATLKAGGAYVPLDPTHPTERWRDTLQDSTPRVVLTHGALAASGQLSDGAGQVVTLLMDAAERPWASASAAVMDTDVEAGADRLAYVIYTSGSTGRPNGVMVEHRQLANLIAWHVERFALSPGKRTSSTAGVAFDACTWEVWPALCSGATLVLPPASTAGDPAALLDWWEAEDLTTSFLVTALAEAALSRGQAGRHGLRQLLTGGDRLNRLPDADLPFELVNNYGPTETTVVATSGTLRHDDAVVHIGRPVANTRIYLLDRHGQPVPQGTPGEIHIGGAQVARGYLNRPDLSRARFLPDPFVTRPEARMYKTGDLGRWLPDGTIEYLGRNDQQVKIRGLRIEPGEIEAQLRSQPSVREAAILAREDVPGERRLVAYVMAMEGRVLEAQALRDALAQMLPGYMVPAAYVLMDALPLTPNGKLDRRALPPPDDSAFAQRAYEAPQGEVEVTLAQVWGELLHVERVGRQDNFFELGGHSLLLTRMLEVARRRGVVMALRQVFDAPTLAALAAVALRDRCAGVAHTLVPLRSTGSQPPLFCFHEGFGTVLVYERLARFIDDDVPVYSVEARALHEYPPVYRPLVDMARDYLDRLVAVQPVGPYRLTGWSGGGLVAYEVARQLLERGESVAFLGMIDTYNVDAEDLEGDIAQAKHYLIRILEYTRPDLPPDVLRALLGLDRLEAMVDECHRNRWLRTDVTAEEMRRRFQVANDIGRACAEYQATALPLSIDLFSAEKPARADRSNGWSALLAGALNIIELEGTHMSIMQDESSLTRVASVMNKALMGIHDAESCQAKASLGGGWT